MTSVGPLRRVGWALLFLPIVLVALVVSAGPASAHAVLESSTPGQGRQLTVAPSEVTLVFSEEVGLTARAVRVVDGRGQRVDTSHPAHADGNPRTLRVGLRSGLGTGSYTVTWRVVSADGHPASGTFSFGVGVPAGAPARTISVDPLVAAVRAVTQLAAYAGTALVLGASVFLFALWPAGQGKARMRRLLVVACLVVVVGAVGALLVQGPYVSGGALAGLFDPGLLRETMVSSYGRPLVLRVVAAVLWIPVLGIWPRASDGEDAGPGGVAAIGNAVTLAASFALTGHPAEASARLLAEAADAVHVVAAGVWLGGLVVLFAAFLPETTESVQQAVLPRWSQVATGCVAALVVTGAYQAWREVRALHALTATAYGRLLLGKLAVVLVLVAFGALARRRVQAPGRLRPVVVTEAILGLVLLGVTVFLVATPPSRVTFGPPYSAALTGVDVEGRPIRVEVTVAPTRTGTQTVRVQAFSMDGVPLTFVAASGQLLVEGGEDATDLTFSPGRPGEGSARVVVPSAGRWTLTLHILTDATTDYAAVTAYTVR